MQRAAGRSGCKASWRGHSASYGKPMQRSEWLSNGSPEGSSTGDPALRYGAWQGLGYSLRSMP